MELEKVVRCLNSQRRRKILQLLSGNDMSAPQLFEKLGAEAPKYRQSINKTLELLKSDGFLNKYYDNEKRGIYFHLTTKAFVVRIDSLSVEPCKDLPRKPNNAEVRD